MSGRTRRASYAPTVRTLRSFGLSAGAIARRIGHGVTRRQVQSYLKQLDAWLRGATVPPKAPEGHP